LRTSTDLGAGDRTSLDIACVECPTASVRQRPHKIERIVPIPAGCIHHNIAGVQHRRPEWLRNIRVRMKDLEDIISFSAYRSRKAMRVIKPGNS
jgi:hypothetical protein